MSCVFDKLTYWNLENPPNSDDAVVMAMDWPELAEVVKILFLITYNKLSRSCCNLNKPYSSEV